MQYNNMYMGNMNWYDTSYPNQMYGFHQQSGKQTKLLPSYLLKSSLSSMNSLIVSTRYTTKMVYPKETSWR